MALIIFTFYPINAIYDFFIVMDNDIRTLDNSDWIDDLSEILNKLSQTEICEIVYLYGDSLNGKLFSSVLYQNNNHTSRDLKI